MAESEFSSQHTSSFPQLLQQLGATLVVSTYQAGQLIFLRNHAGKLNTHFTALERPMGLAGDAARLSIGTSHQAWTYRNIPAVAAKVPLIAEQPYDACFIPQQMHITGDIDIHEMAYGLDERGKPDELWIVNTKMSCLCTLDKHHSIVPRWRPKFISAYDLTDRCHLNGLALKDGKPKYVSALGATDSAGGWRANKASGGLIMDVDNQQIIASGLSMPHSPRWHDGKLWYLESGAGQLCILNPNTGKKKVVAEMPGFTRGLDFAGRYAFVGLSQVRETAVFAGLPLTQRVADRKCGVWVIDTQRREIVAFVEFVGNVQEVFAVQLMPWKNPTVLDLVDPLVRSSYVLPDEVISLLAKQDPQQIRFEQALELHRQGKFDQAIADYEELLAQKPDWVAVHIQLGMAHHDSDNWLLALENLQQAVAIDTKNAEVYNTLGIICMRLQRYDDAQIYFDQAIQADKKFAIAYFNRGFLKLLLGNYASGWDDFEWRWQMPTFFPFQCAQPLWKGEDISDKTLLVHTEQGNGDNLQSMRFLPLLKARCKKLLVVCTEPMRTMFKAVDCVDEVRLGGNLPADSFDVYLPLMSAPHLLNITLDNMPAPQTYLKIPKNIYVPRLDELHGSAAALKVGLVWAGNSTFAADKYRSTSLEQMQLITQQQSGVAFFALQTPLKSEDLALIENLGIHNLEPELNSYAHTAALVEQLDLVICTCTSVAHLAAGLGKPTWVVLGQHTDWRWLLDREDTPWYPTVRLFRKTDDEETWQPIFERVKTALQHKLAESKTLQLDAEKVV